MSRRRAVVQRGHERGVALVEHVVREFHLARIDHAVSQQDVGDAIGVDRSWVSRRESGALDPGELTIVRASEMLAVVGLDLAGRVYPAAGPLRDGAHLGVLERLRGRVHPRLGWGTEVLFPGIGELRAWDAKITGRDWRTGVECEMHPADLQAAERRLHRRKRDGDVDSVILLMPDTAYVRRLVREHADELLERFPVPGRVALQRLSAGSFPGGDSVIIV